MTYAEERSKVDLYDLDMNLEALKFNLQQTPLERTNRHFEACKSVMSLQDARRPAPTGSPRCVA